MLKFRVVIGLHNTDVDDLRGGEMVESPVLPLDTSKLIQIVIGDRPWTPSFVIYFVYD